MFDGAFWCNVKQLWSTETTFISDSILKVTGKGKKLSYN